LPLLALFVTSGGANPGYALVFLGALLVSEAHNRHTSFIDALSFAFLTALCRASPVLAFMISITVCVNCARGGVFTHACLADIRSTSTLTIIADSYGCFRRFQARLN